MTPNSFTNKLRPLDTKRRVIRNYIRKKDQNILVQIIVDSSLRHREAVVP
jgi:hypothetical protein